MGSTNAGVIEDESRPVIIGTAGGGCGVVLAEMLILCKGQALGGGGGGGGGGGEYF